MSARPDASTPRRPNPLLAVLGRALEATLDRVIDLDPDTRASLRALDGRALTIEFRDTPLAMRIAVVGDRLAIGPAFDGESALRVSTTPSALIGLALARGRDGAVGPGRVDIAGDAELARRIERIATRFAPDFDEAFARVFGDVAGHHIAKGLRTALAALRESAQGFARDSADFLTDESRDVIAKAELDGFLDDVDALRERAERLEARVRRLAQSGNRPA